MCECVCVRSFHQEGAPIWRGEDDVHLGTPPHSPSIIPGEKKLSINFGLLELSFEHRVESFHDCALSGEPTPKAKPANELFLQ